MLRVLVNGMLVCAAVVAVAALAHADETVIEHRVESPPAVREHVEERTVTQPATVKKRTETVVTKSGDNDNADNDNDDNENDND